MTNHESAKLTTQLGEILKEINQLRADIASLTETAATDEEHQRLILLRSRLDGALAREVRKRAEIADAREREQAVELEKAWAVAAEAAERKHTSADKIDAIVVMLFEAI